MGRAGSGPEFHVNSGSGCGGSLHLWVGLGRVKKTGPCLRTTLCDTHKTRIIGLLCSEEIMTLLC